MTMINRSQPHAKPDLAITDVEMKLLDHLLPDKDPTTSHAGTLSSYLVKIARLGGYLARASDPPPGNTVMWRGLTRLTDTKLGATIRAELIGKVHRTLTIKNTAYAAGSITELKCARYRPANPDVHRHLSG
ncbi:hypothetical protein [Mesorhizobium sp. L48C026A00]|uniref:hypothetical protein n=1 Tax=Mesorhizobium sp. L48C026A00 TaxID=1287182 RepID=UPI0012EC8FF0|nr:hypothetical protein [Mesorhizobium sp. L48C026A00]